MRKVQLPVLGGNRKVITVPSAIQQAGTTISEFANQTISLAQLKAALGITTTKGSSGGAAPASLVVGPGLSGGGVLTGSVPLNLIAPIPAFVFEEGGGGGDGDPGPPGLPGPTGPTGATGAAGANGPAVFFLPDDPEYALDAVPGAVGPVGSTGAMGPVGPAIFLSSDDGENGDPGPPGPQGPPGAAPSVAFPGTLPDLVLWWESDDINLRSGGYVSHLRDRTPWQGGVFADQAASPTTSGVVTVSSTQLNSLNVLSWAGSANGRMTIRGFGTPVLDNSTIFVVVQPSVTGTEQVLLGANTNGLEFDLTSGNQFQIAKTFTANIGANAATFTSGTWYQVNATYNSSTGAWAFRVNRAAGSSGTNVQAITGPSNGIGYNVQGGIRDLNALVAAIIVYNRVLTGTEISNMESYLHTKWGV